jgi:two-component system sensor histidine kinase AlgZ
MVSNGRANPWTRLGLISFFVQWVVLVATAILCRARLWLAKQRLWQAALYSYLTILLVTALFSEIAYFVVQYTDWGSGLRNKLALQINNLSIAGIVGAVMLRYFYLQQDYRRRLRKEAEARVQALQSRIHPHFLFNTMNILASLTRRDPVLAERVIEDLSDLFRASLAVTGSRATVQQELDLCSGYLRIEQLRLGERLHFDIDCDEEAKTKLLPLLSVQPLVENAVYHGVQPRAAGGSVSVLVTLSDKMLSIEVRNPLPESEARHSGHGVALDNIRERLQVLYGSKAQLRTVKEEHDFVALLRLPVE